MNESSKLTTKDSLRCCSPQLSHILAITNLMFFCFSLSLYIYIFIATPFQSRHHPHSLLSELFQHVGLEGHRLWRIQEPKGCAQTGTSQSRWRFTNRSLHHPPFRRCWWHQWRHRSFAFWLLSPSCRSIRTYIVTTTTQHHTVSSNGI